MCSVIRSPISIATLPAHNYHQFHCSHWRLCMLWEDLLMAKVTLVFAVSPLQFNIQHSPVVYHLHPSNHEIFGIDGKYLEMLVLHIFTRPQAGNTQPPPAPGWALCTVRPLPIYVKSCPWKHKLCGSGCHGMGGAVSAESTQSQCNVTLCCARTAFYDLLEADSLNDVSFLHVLGRIVQGRSENKRFKLQVQHEYILYQQNIILLSHLPTK